VLEIAGGIVVIVGVLIVNTRGKARTLVEPLGREEARVL